MTQIGIYILGTSWLQFTSTLICIERWNVERKMGLRGWKYLTQSLRMVKLLSEMWELNQTLVSLWISRCELEIFVLKNLKKYYIYRVFCFYFRVCWGDISDVCECEDELKDANTENYEKTPAAMNTMLEKQPRPEALLKRQQRSITAVHSTNLQ